MAVVFQEDAISLLNLHRSIYRGYDDETGIMHATNNPLIGKKLH